MAKGSRGSSFFQTWLSLETSDACTRLGIYAALGCCIGCVENIQSTADEAQSDGVTCSVVLKSLCMLAGLAAVGYALYIGGPILYATILHYFNALYPDAEPAANKFGAGALTALTFLIAPCAGFNLAGWMARGVEACCGGLLEKFSIFNSNKDGLVKNDGVALDVVVVAPSAPPTVAVAAQVEFRALG